MNRSAGKLFTLFVLISCIVLSSCIMPWQGKPLDPGLLFTIGSDFLQNTSSMALRGTIRFKGLKGSQSGSFQMIMNKGDSLMFLIEGPLKIDIFKLVVIGTKAYALDRESPDWTTYGQNDRLEIPEYGIEGLAPFDIGHFVFPQFYFQNSIIDGSGKKILLISNQEFIVKSNPDRRSFSIWNQGLNLFAVYGKRKDRSDGYFPAEISIFPNDRKWEISLKIEKIKLNPRIPSRVWERNP